MEVDLPADTIIGDVESHYERGDRDFHGIVQQMIEEAVNYHDEEIDPLQVKATRYYRGDPFGNEEAGRSKVVATVVRDTVQAILPSLMRIFWGPEQVVSFRPERAEDIPGAEQATDYVNHIVKEQNPGFTEVYACFKDALIRKMGVLTWWYEEPTVIEGDEYSGLTEEELVQLGADSSLELTDIESEPMGGIEGAPLLFSAKVRRQTKKGGKRFAAVPPEEIVWSPNARSMEDARAMVWVRSVPASDLVAMGYDRDIIDTKRGTTYGGDARSRGYEDPEMPEERRIDRGAYSQDEDVQDSSTRPVLYCEAYIYIDTDDDGIAEMRKICTAGDDYEILNGDFGELVTERPFALFCPDPEAHAIIGQSIADYVMDLQLIDSQIWRGMLDSLNWSLNPEREVVEGEVNMQDLFNTEIGKNIRVLRPGMVRDIMHDFIGREALSVLAYTQEVRENRTGISKAAAGLDADALQSSTKAAVAATMTGAQQHIELIARIFAETGMKALYKGLLKLSVQHQDKEEVIRLRGEYVPVDPRTWNADMDVDVNVALGAGLADEKLMALAMIAEKQEQVLSMGGPIAGWKEYRATLAKMAELAGHADATMFWKPFGDEEQAAMDQQQAQQAQQQQQNDPMQMALQIEQQKLQLEQQKNQMELNMKQQELVLNQDYQRDKLAMDSKLKELELELKYKADIDDAQLRADVARDRAALDADVKREAEARKQAAQREQQAAAQAQAAQGGMENG
jgi:hypothetical protein